MLHVLPDFVFCSVVVGVAWVVGWEGETRGLSALPAEEIKSADETRRETFVEHELAHKLSAIDITKPYKFIGFGAIDITKPYKFIGFGAIDITKPYKFIGFWGCSFPCGLVWGAAHLGESPSNGPGGGSRREMCMRRRWCRDFVFLSVQRPQTL